MPDERSLLSFSSPEFYFTSSLRETLVQVEADGLVEFPLWPLDASTGQTHRAAPHRTAPRSHPEQSLPAASVQNRGSPAPCASSERRRYIHSHTRRSREDSKRAGRLEQRYGVLAARLSYKFNYFGAGIGVYCITK